MPLVVSRRKNESVVLEVGGKRVVVRVIATTNRQVKLLLVADQDVKILREELLGMNKDENFNSVNDDHFVSGNRK